MRTRTRTALAGFALVTTGLISGPALAVVPVTGTAPTLTPVTINNSPGDQNDPHVSGDWAAYTDSIAIRYYNFTTGVDAQIPLGSSARDLLSDISGSKVVLSRVITGVKNAVMVFDAATGAAPLEIDPAAATNRLGSAIGGDTVAYVDFGFHANGELVRHDLVSARQVRVTTDAAFDQSPQVSPDGHVMVWEHCATSSTNCDIWQTWRTADGWSVSPVADSTNAEGNPDTNGALVTYDSFRAGNGDVFWRPVTGGAEVRLELPGFELNPSIAGDYIAFEARPTLFDTTDILVYDVVQNRLYQLTNTPLVTEQLNDIAVLPDGRLRVVWASDEDGFDQRNIKAATFRLRNHGLYRNKSDFVAVTGTITTVDFDRNACGAAISAPGAGVLAGSRYANAGVTFAAGVITPDATSASSPNIVSNSGVNTPTPALVDGTFATPVAAVGITNVGAGAVLRVYDSSGTLIASLTTDTSTAASDFVGIVSTTPIKRFEFDFVSGLGFGGDDLVFTKIATPDCTPPAITAPTGITTSTDSGTCGAVVPYTVSATDDVAVASLSSSPASGSTFPKGTTTVTVTATDTSGNTATKTFAVIVNDGEPPTLTVPPNVATGTDAGKATATVNPGSASASDNCAGVTFTSSRSDGQPLSAAYPLGTTTITWTATDASGNVTTATQTVTVTDLEPPVVTCPPSITIDATSPSGATVTYTASASDNVGVATTTFSQPSGSPFPIGTTTVGYTATDAAGNSATCSFNVAVLGAPNQIAALIALVQIFNLKQGIENSLDAKLQNVLAALTAANAGDLTSACNKLDAFLNEVAAQSGKALTTTEASQLLTAATQIKAALGCP